MSQSNPQTQAESTAFDVGVIDTGSELNEFSGAQAVWQDGGQKHTTRIIDANGEEHKIVEGKIVYMIPTSDEGSVIPSVEELKEQHKSRYSGRFHWAEG
jgi:imidazolonepropionase-like amidohydrolase